MLSKGKIDVPLDKETWIATRFEEKLGDEARMTFSMLPTEVQQGLIRAAWSLYDFGFQHGGSFRGSAIEPVYHVPLPKVEIVPDAQNVA